VSELIHSSAAHPGLDTARVSVQFQEIIDTGEESYEVVPASAFTVARTAHRNNTSAYYVDGRKSSFTEVTDLLKGKGVDLDNNRFLILQGEVEQIAMMKPKAPTPHEAGLLEYLEDIIGTDRHVPALEAGAARLDGLNEKRQAALARARAAERERDGLEGPRAAAEAYLAKEADAAAARRLVYELRGREARRALAKAAADAAALEVKMEHETAKLAAASADLAAAEAEHAGLAATHDACAARLEAARDAFAACEREDVACREALKHLRGKAARLGERAAAEAGRAAAAAAAAGAADADAPEHVARSEKLAGALARARADAEALREGAAAEVAARTADLGAAREAAAPAEAAVAAAAARVEVAAAARDVAARAAAAAVKRLAEAEAGAAAADRAAQTADADAAGAREGAAAAAAEAEAARSEAAAARAEADRLTDAIRTAREGLAGKQRAAAAIKNAGAAAAALAAASDSGDLVGYVGRLGDLGSIDPAYDAAVSSACPALDNFVVTDTAAAQRCVDLLRKGKLGVATFLILDKQAGLAKAASRPGSPPESAPRLYDLIRPASPDLAPAFFYATRDTVVAADLEQATRIAYGPDRRWARAVTLAGELVNEAGTLTGGGGKPRTGRMRVGKGPPPGASAADRRAAAAEIERGAADLAAAERACATAKAATKDAEARARAADRRAADLGASVPRAQLEADAARARAADLRGAMAGLRPRAAAAAGGGGAAGAEEADAGAALAAAQAAVVAAQADAAPFREGVALAARALEEAGGPGLQAKKAAVKALERSIAQADADAARARAGGSAARKAAAAAAAAAEATAKERDDVLAALADREAQFKAVEERALAVMADAQAAGAELEGQVAGLEAATAALDAKRREVGVIRGVEAEIQAALADIKEAAEAEGVKLAKLEDKAAAAREALKAAAVAQAEGAAEDAAALAAAAGAAKAATAATEAAEAAAAAADEAAIAAAAADGDDGTDKAVGEDGGDGEAMATDEAEGGSGKVEAGADPAAADPAAAAAAAALAAAVAAPPPPPLSDADLDAASLEDAQYRVAVLEDELARAAPDLAAVAAHRRAAADAAAKGAALDALTASRNAVRAAFDGLRKRRLDEFMAGFNAISLRLKEMYQMITLGGDAELELVDSLDPFAEGVVFSVRPPKKAWKNIANLSGGEKTLSSLALVFALHHFKPTPLYVMDEIDAALDFKNVSIVAHYIKERTRGAQFIIISLRNDMFELADRLVGIYKTHDATKSVAIDPRDYATAEAPLPAAAPGAAKKGVVVVGGGGGVENQPAAVVA